MLIDAAWALAMRCPRCGRLEIARLSLFEWQGPQPAAVQCHCGRALASVVRRGHLYHIEIECVICEATHGLVLNVAQVIHDEALVLYCPTSDVDLALIGTAPAVEELLTEEGDIVANVLSPGLTDSEFADADIIRAVLARLQSWADDGRLYCGCGNLRLGVELFADKIEVVCPRCGAVLAIYAEREEDLLALEGLAEVVLKRGAFTCIDSTDFRYRHGV